MHGHSFVDLIINAVVRSAVYHVVDALVRGHTMAATLVMCAALVAGAWFVSRHLRWR